MTVVLSPDITDDSLEGSFDQLVRQPVTSRGGEIVEMDSWGRRKLAYPISRHLEGHYFVSQVRLDPSQIADMESGFRISDEILRHLIVKVGE